MANINYEWNLIQNLFPRKHRKTIEVKLISLHKTGLYKFAAHRDSRLNYQLVIPNGSTESVGFIRLK